MTEITAAKCPVCAANLTADPAFVQWCEACEWNLEPTSQKVEGRSRWQKWLDLRADRLARQLYESVRAHPPSKRRGAILSAVVMATAGLVHLVTLALLVGAVVLLAVPGGPPVWLRIIGAVLLVGLAYFVWPFPRRRRRGIELSRQEAPELFGLIDDVARAIGAPSVDSVALSSAFNASYSTRGLRRRVLGIGMSLWTVLGAQEQVALLGHELGHAVNGDLRNTKLVGRAMISLARWQQLLRPDRPRPWTRRAATSQQGLVNLAERVILPIVLIPLVFIIGAFSRTLDVLANRDGQRREYYADELAARAGGSEAAVRLIELLLLNDLCARAVIQAVRFRQASDPWQVEREAVGALPASEFERRRRLARRKLNRIDVTHPPTQLRGDLLRDRPPTQPVVSLDAPRAERIDRELEPFKAKLVTQVRDMIGAQ